jgi:hypothetical protein
MCKYSSSAAAAAAAATSWGALAVYLACFVGCLVEAVADDCGVDALFQQLLRLLEQRPADDNHRRGAIASNNVLQKLTYA